MEETSVNEEKIISIEIERLKDFKDHPFRVRSDRDMQKLLASIKQYGILSPLIVRPIPEGVYEIISGHRGNTPHSNWAIGRFPSLYVP